MNENRNLIKGLVACGMALAMVSTLAAQEQQVAAKVVRIKGIARYTTGNNIWQPLKAGMVVKAGTVIQTGLDKDSYVDLVLGEGDAASVLPIVYNPRPTVSSAKPSMKAYEAKARQSVVRLFENTVVGLDKLTCVQTGADDVTDTQLDLKLGHVFFNVKKLSATSKFEIKLPNGVAGIRGTCGHVWAVGKISVGAGAVVISFVNSKTGEIKTETVETGKCFDFTNFDATKFSDLTRREKVEIDAIIRDAASEAGISPGKVATVSSTTPIEVLVSPH
jgi:hypothetical protein